MNLEEYKTKMWQPYVIKRSTTWRWPLWRAMLPGLLLASYSVGATGEVTLNISGTLRKPACEVAQEDQIIEVDFQTIILKDLAQGPTPPRQFKVRLQNCDLQTNEAKVTITGTEAPGKLLALDADSTASGVGIGFKQGQAMTDDLPLNTQSNGQPLNEGNSTLYFGAYVQKLPEAVLTEGAFSATATLHIEYF